MGDKAAIAPTGGEGLEGSEEESDIDKYFESDDEIKENLKTLLTMPLEFMEDSSEDEAEPEAQAKNKSEEDSVERQLEALFVGERKTTDTSGESAKDMGLENISDIEFDGPESGECDTSDGELPDSPKVVVTLPETPVVDLASLDGDSDGDLKMEYHSRSGEYYNAVSQKISIAPKPEREVIIGNIVEPEKQMKIREKKEKDVSKSKDKIGEKLRSKEKKEKKNKISESILPVDEDKKKEIKMKKYLGKCLEYFFEMSKKNEINKESKDDVKSETKKNRSAERRHTKLKSIVEKVSKEKDTSPLSSASSKIEKISLSSHSSGFEKVSQIGELKRRSVSLEKERKSKTDKKSKSKSKELKEHKYRYRKYLQYLQEEREKCYEERLALEKHKSKVKRKRRKSESSSPEKYKETPVISKSKFLSFPDFCNSRELIPPDDEIVKLPATIKKYSPEDVNKKERTLSMDSLATTSTARSEQVDNVDDDPELFITYSDLVEQDKLKIKSTQIEKDRDKIETILENDPELKSISVFTSVLFKGSSDSNGIPFLQESRAPSPNHSEEPTKPKTDFTVSTGPDEIYDWNDDLSTISQSSLSPSRSPAPKVHNKALFNFLENQKERSANERVKKVHKSTKYSRSRSKSPKRERLKKRKKHRSKSISRSPPPKPKSPEVHKKRVSPPAYLKERWRDYPSPTERRREHYDRPPKSRRRSRSRTRPRGSHGHSHRSRSSSEERSLPPSVRRYRSRSRTRSPAPPPVVMVHTSGAEKRRLLKEEHERALASLRATIRKPNNSLPIPFTADGDSYEPMIRDNNYDPVVMNEVPGAVRPMEVPHHRDTFPSHFSAPTPHYFYYPPHQYY